MPKKANIVGFAIIGLAILLLLGSVVTQPSSPISDGSSSGGVGSGSSGGGSSSGGSSGENQNELFDVSSSILFEINSTTLGREMIRIIDFPNMRIGSAVEYDELDFVRDIKLISSSFNSNSFTSTIPRSVVDDDNFLGILLVMYPRDGKFENEVGIIVNSQIYGVEKSTSRLPLVIDAREFQRGVDNRISLTLREVNWFDLFTTYEEQFNEIRVIAMYQDSRFSQRSLDFILQTSKENLNFLRLKFSVVCPVGEDGSTPIEAYVNNFKVMSQNPTCATRDGRGTVLSAHVPVDILRFSTDNINSNTILIDTFGTYETSLQIEEVSFNTDFEYSFFVSRSRNVQDVVIFGDFDREFLDIQINSYRFQLPRRETTSIRTRLRSGRNELIIHDAPVEIRQLLIEQILRE